MQYFAMTVEEKNELCKKGYKCLGMHRVFVDKVFTGQVKWEFTLPDPVVEITPTLPVKIVPAVEKIVEVKPKKVGRPKGSKGAK